MRQLLTRAMKLPPGPRRTAALAEWLQGLYPAGTEPAALVGGAAVELYTHGAYTTGDLDFVGSLPTQVADGLRRSGFLRRGRHWVHEAGKVFLEFPGERLQPASPPVRLRIGGWTVFAIGPEALLADRLAAWKYWRSAADAVNALRLLQVAGSRMNPRLAARLARELDVDDERRRMIRWARRLGGRVPTEEEIERWLKHRR